MKKSMFLFMLLSISTKIIAQNSSIAIGEIHILSSEILQEERQLAIYTPEGYATSTKKYPVLYLLDADWHFPYVAGLVR